MTTVADVMVETLRKAGIKRIYGIVGDSLNAITNSLSQQKDIEWIHVRHEEVAAFAAGAEAQLTGELSVCAGSCGPGNLHLINGLYDANRSRAPVLAIAAHIPTSEIGGEYFQETHPNILFKDCSCFCEVVLSVDHIPRLLNIAMQTAIAKRGVAVLVISGDIAMQTVKDKIKTTALEPQPVAVLPQPAVLQKIAALLNESKNITLFCGHGCADAHAEVLALAETLQAPIVHTLRGKEYIEYDNPYDVGMTGFIGFSSGYYAMESCDTLLLLGTSFPYRQFYPEKARIIQIDINGEQIGKRCAVDVGAVGDVKETIKALLPLLNKHTDSAFLQKAVKHYHKARADLDALAVGKPGSKLIHPQYLTKLVNEIATDDAVFTCDVGTPTVWTARYVQMNGKRRLLGSFNHGSMANALAQSIGAAASYPKRQVIAMCGDGGFAMLMGDILTLVQQKLPIKVIIFNNGTLGFVQMEMRVAGMLDYGTDLQNPNFAQMAEAIGIQGIKIEDQSELEAGLRKGFAHDGPTVFDIHVNPTELIMPPTINMSQVTGMGLFMIKAIINGRGDEVVQLVQSNLWR